MGLGTPGISINHKLLWQKIFFKEIQQAWVSLFLCQISARANDNNRQNLLLYRIQKKTKDSRQELRYGQCFVHRQTCRQQNNTDDHCFVVIFVTHVVPVFLGNGEAYGIGFMGDNTTSALVPERKVGIQCRPQVKRIRGRSCLGHCCCCCFSRATK